MSLSRPNFSYHCLPHSLVSSLQPSCYTGSSEHIRAWFLASCSCCSLENASDSHASPQIAFPAPGPSFTNKHKLQGFGFKFSLSALRNHRNNISDLSFGVVIVNMEVFLYQTLCHGVFKVKQCNFYYKFICSNVFCKYPLKHQPFCRLVGF